MKKDEDLDPESRHLLVKKHQDYIRNGLKLPKGSKRDRFKYIKTHLSKLTLEFRRNVIEENGGVWFLPQELDGVSNDLLSELEKGEGENNGKLRLTFQYPDFYPAMRYAKDGETRKRIYIANENKLKQNVALFKDVVVLRDEAARMLHYPNHAAFRLEAKMAKKPETVNKFLMDLQSRLTAGAMREVDKLKRLKEIDLTSRGQVFDGHFWAWDLSFYNRLMLETQYQVDQASISEYFSLQSTINGMLKIFQRLFGLKFFEISDSERAELAPSGNGNDLIWHEDVQMFHVWNDDELGGEFAGYLYLDLYPREGKYGHAASYPLCPVRQKFVIYAEFNTMFRALFTKTVNVSIPSQR
jgi:metallopeptidase MepB